MERLLSSVAIKNQKLDISFNIFPRRAALRDNYEIYYNRGLFWTVRPVLKEIEITGEISL
jgi:hypothetical protein